MTKIRIAIMSILAGGLAICYADQIAVVGKDRELLFRLKEMESISQLTSNQVTDVVISLESEFDEIRTEAMKVILLHRRSDLWRENSSRVTNNIGASKELAGLLSRIFEERNFRQRPVVDIIPDEVRNGLPLRSTPQPPQPKGGNLKIDDVLLDIVVVDLMRNGNNPVFQSAIPRIKAFRLGAEREEIIQSFERGRP